ncbi:hypothetical protein L916_16577, partial [Phytophthora nicotianae]
KVESSVGEVKSAKKSHKSKKGKLKSKKEEARWERSPSLSSAIHCSQPAPKRYFRFDLTVGTSQEIADDLQALFKEVTLKAFFDWRLNIPYRSQQLLSGRRKSKRKITLPGSSSPA